MKFNTTSITFIGGGNMARSLISGLIKQGFLQKNIQVIEPDKNRASQLRQDFLIDTHSKANSEILNVDIIVFAIKPQIFKSVCSELATFLTNSSSILLSIAAGISTKSIRLWLDKEDAKALTIVRAMPNTPATIGLGATGLFCATKLQSSTKSNIDVLFNSVGVSTWVTSENELDTVTALSGSGPAYFFAMYEHLIKAGVELGLNPEQAFHLVVNTALGSAQMAMKAQNQDIKTLRENVTSKGGTTEAGLNILEKENFEEIVKKVVNSAKNRSKELSIDNF